MRFLMTAMIWTVSLACLVVAGAITTEFIMMPVSLDIGEMVTAGSEPWETALVAGLAFAGLVVLTGVSLRLWHTVRFKVLALVLTAAEVAAVFWSGVMVYREYF